MAGEAEVECETVGLEITAGFEFIPLVTASDGSLQPVQALAHPRGIEFDGGMPSIPGNNVPVFYDDGAGPGTAMQLLITPWFADYDKMLSTPWGRPSA